MEAFRKTPIIYSFLAVFAGKEASKAPVVVHICRRGRTLEQRSAPPPHKNTFKRETYFISACGKIEFHATFSCANLAER